MYAIPLLLQLCVYVKVTLTKGGNTSCLVKGPLEALAFDDFFVCLIILRAYGMVNHDPCLALLSD